MRGKVLVLLIALFGTLIFSCKSDEEEPIQWEPLLLLTDQNVISGLFYEGKALINTCEDDPAYSTCYYLKEQEPEVFKQTEKNFTLSLKIEDNEVRGELKFLTVHGDYTVHEFQTDVTGESQETNEDIKILRFDPVLGIESKRSDEFFLNIDSLVLEMDRDTLKGDMSTYITFPDMEQENPVNITYSINLEKVL